MITTHLPNLTLFVAQINNDASRQEAYRRGYSLILMLSLLGLLLIGMLLIIILMRRSRLRRQQSPKLDSTEHVDAWAESGKRFDSSITEIDISQDDEFDQDEGNH